MTNDKRRELGKAKMAEISKLPAFDPPEAFTAAICEQVFGTQAKLSSDLEIAKEAGLAGTI